jgi:predicted ATPase
LAEVLPLFAGLLSVPLPDRYPPLTLTPDRQRQQTHDALVAWLLEETERQPVLAVREDLRWAAHAPVTQVTFPRLGHPEVEAMITHLTGDRALPAEVVQQIVAKTDGVPLFVEELVKMLLESGLVRQEDECYALMARLDRLAAARDLAQLGAILGRSLPQTCSRRLRQWMK